MQPPYIILCSRFAFANFYNSDDLPLMSQNDADNILSRHADIVTLFVLNDQA